MMDPFQQTPVPSGRQLFLRYLMASSVLNLLWEILQLPLYTLWSANSPIEMAFAVLHCTLGDLLIASITFSAAILLIGVKHWQQLGYWQTAFITTALGIGYTVFSEWNNTVVTQTWAYSSLMPTFLGIGISPLAQWLVIPTYSFWHLRAHRKPGTAN